MYLSCLILPLPHTTWFPLIPNHLLFYNVLYFQNRVPFICYLLESDCEESWAPKNWCFWPVVLEKTLESPLDWKDVQPVHPKRDQSWVFIGRTDAEAETPVLWPPHVKSWLIGKDPDAGKDWRQEEKGMTEDEKKRFVCEPLTLKIKSGESMVKQWFWKAGFGIKTLFRKYLS